MFLISLACWAAILGSEDVTLCGISRTGGEALPFGMGTGEARTGAEAAPLVPFAPFVALEQKNLLAKRSAMKWPWPIVCWMLSHCACVGWLQIEELERNMWLWAYSSCACIAWIAINMLVMLCYYGLDIVYNEQLKSRTPMDVSIQQRMLNVESLQYPSTGAGKFQTYSSRLNVTYPL